MKKYRIYLPLAIALMVMAIYPNLLTLIISAFVFIRMVVIMIDRSIDEEFGDDMFIDETKNY